MSSLLVRTLHAYRRNCPLGIASFRRYDDSKLRLGSIRWYCAAGPKPQKAPNLTQRVTKKLFGKYLLTTNILGSGLLMVIGDAAAQEIEYRRGLVLTRCDLWRSARMFIVGCLQGPLHHYFYKWMDTIMPVVTMSSVFKKIALDQFVMSPVCIVLFFYPAGLLEGKNLNECHEEIKSKFLTVYMVDWLVWPFAQFCNFYWLHPKYRVTYVNVVTAVYNIFLSYIKHEEKPTIS